MELHEYQKMFEIERDYWWFAGKRALVLDQLRAAVPAGGRICDIGCGTGIIIETCEPTWESHGIDSSSEALAFCRQRGLRKLVCAEVTSGLAIKAGQFDAVMMLDLLEHLDEEGPALEQVHRILRPGGKLIVTVPALEWLWSDHDVALHHRRRYDRRQISRVLERAGFEVERLSFFNSILLPIAAGLRLAKRLLVRRREGEPAKTDFFHELPGWVNGFFRRILDLEIALIRRFDLSIGLSILVIARRGGPAG